MRSTSKPIRAVVDTNLLVSGLISQRGAPHQLISAWRKGAFLLLVTDQLQAEYESVLARPKLVEKYGLSSTEIAALLRRIQTGAGRVRPLRILPVSVRDPKDEMVLAAALGGKADYLVTGDEDLLVLRNDPKLRT